MAADRWRIIPAGQQTPIRGIGGPVIARRGAERSPTGGQSGADAAIARSRQPDARPLHRQLPVELDQRAGRPVNVVQVVVGPDRVCRRARTSGRRLHQIHLRRSSQAGPHRDCRPAPRRYSRASIDSSSFPTRRSCSRPSISDFCATRRLADNETAVAVINDFPRLVDDILQLLPQTKQVFMVTGSGQLGQFWHRELESEFKRFHGPADVCLVRRSVPSGDPAPLCEPATRLGDLLSRLRHGRAGGAYADERVLADLHATANAPAVLQRTASLLGHGIVGGTLMSIDDLSRNTADVAVRLLNGAPPSSIRRAATSAWATDIRLARVAAVGHRREPVAAGQRRALSRSEPVAANTGARC